MAYKTNGELTAPNNTLKSVGFKLVIWVGNVLQPKELCVIPIRVMKGDMEERLLDIC